MPRSLLAAGKCLRVRGIRSLPPVLQSVARSQSLAGTRSRCLGHTTAAGKLHTTAAARQLHSTPTTNNDHTNSSSTTTTSAPTNTTAFPSYTHLTVQHKLEPCNHLVVKINRPKVHNAFNAEVIEELHAVFQHIITIVASPPPPSPSKRATQISQQQHTTDNVSSSAASSPDYYDHRIRAVVLTGEGSSFSAGADLQWMKSMKQYSKQQNVEDSTAMFDMFNSIYRCPVPVIARVNGPALGGGVGLVAAADIAVAAADKALFGLTEVRLGLAPAVISKYVHQKVGNAASSFYWLTGQRFKADVAKQINLVNVVEPNVEAVDAYIHQHILSALAESSPQAVSETKKLVQYVSAKTTPEECQSYVTNLIASLRVSDEGQEGLNAFFGKRQPAWNSLKK